MSKKNKNVRGLNIEDLTLEDIYDFLDTRGENMSQEMAYYMELLQKVYDMDNRPMKFGSRDIIIKHLMKFEKLSRYLANKIYDDAIEYFYSNVSITKEAHRNRIADRHERLINMAIGMIEDVNDVFKLLKANKDLIDILDLNKEDEFLMEDSDFLKPFQILSMDAEQLQLPTRVDRKKLEEWVKELPELTEGEKDLILQESLIKPLKLFPDEHENIRKSN